MPIKLSLKSVFVAWSRTLCVALMVAIALVLLVNYPLWHDNRRESWKLSAAICALVFFPMLFFVPRLFSKASPSRAAQLAELAQRHDRRTNRVHPQLLSRFGQSVLGDSQPTGETLMIASIIRLARRE